MIALLKNLKPYRRSLIVIFILMFIRTLSELLLPYMMSDIINNGVINGDTAYILSMGGIMLVIALFGGSTSILSSYLSAKTGVGFAKDIRAKVFRKITAFSQHEMDEFGASSLITRSTNDITQIQNVVIMMTRIAIRAPFMAIGSVIMAISTDLNLSGIILVVVVLMGIIIASVASRTIPMFKVIQKKVDQLNLVIRERLTGLRVIRAFNRVEKESLRFESANRELMETTVNVNRVMAVMMPLMTLIFNLTTIAIVWYGTMRIDDGFIEIGSMMAFLQYAMMLLFSVMMLTMVFIMIPRASASATRINDVLAVSPEITDPQRTTMAGAMNGHIRFENVTFSYHSDHGAEAAAINDISFESKPGEVTAIIGGTGSGKSTLVSLIPRLYDVTKGRILVDGIDVREMTLKDLRSRIGLVPQKTFLFSGTVEDNIKYGDETADEATMMKALEVAQAVAFIDEKDGGIQSEVAQGGANLSGGQKQRLSIARALVRHPEIYIFDDSFSALDYKTESKLRAALMEQLGNSTVLIVAQKVASVMEADRIIVLDEGRIVGEGTHEELLETNAIYREIVASQLKEEAIA